jgi:hypothetical protein
VGRTSVTGAGLDLSSFSFALALKSLDAQIEDCKVQSVASANLHFSIFNLHFAIAVRPLASAQ